jgi:hypothetical protein
MDGSATYCSVVKRGLRPEGPDKAPPAKQRQPAGGVWDAPAEVSLTAVRVERLPEKPLAKRDVWDSECKARAKDFVDAVLTGDPEMMKDAFYDREFGKNPKLYERIRQKKTTGWRPWDEEGNLIRWFRDALKDRSIGELEAISENLYIEFGGHGWIFDETRKALAFSVGELIHADAMVRTALDNGEIDATARRFEGQYKTLRLGNDQCLAQMALLMRKFLPTLEPEQKATLKENLARAPHSLAITALRSLL